MIAVNTNTSGTRFVLASLLAAYPEKSFADHIRVLLEDEGLGLGSGDGTSEKLGSVREELLGLIDDEARLDELRSEYIDLFDRGRQVNSLYETEYGRSRALVKGNELVDIGGFYRAFGFETGGDGVLAEMIDHVAVELEFYALLLLKEQVLTESGAADGAEIVRDARGKFLKSHLGRFVGSICDRPGVKDSRFYSKAFEYCRRLVDAECELMGVQPELESWIQGETEGEAVACGGGARCSG